MTLQEKVTQFPKTPGVYLMKDADGKILYIGKASDLKKRVMSYFVKRTEDRYQIHFLMKKVRDVETIVTTNEKEALLLENTLIKKHKPKYNIQLRDDKSYLSLKFSTQDKFPRLYVTRRIKKDGSLYFGPYSSALACRETVDFIEKHFRLRTCSDHEFANRVRPCIQYQIHRCDAPCVGFIGKEDYRKIVDQACSFLQGRKQDLLKEVTHTMEALAHREEFEKAAQARDLIDAIRKTLEKQQVARHAWIDQDAIGVHREGEKITCCVLQIREGKVWESRLYHLQSYQEDKEVLEEFSNQYYGEDRLIPDEVLIPLALERQTELEEILTERRGKKCRLITPQRGDRNDLVELTRRNAQEGFHHHQVKQAEVQDLLGQLQQAASFQNLPRRIECFDISNLSGRQAVGSLVCFLEGEPFKAGYRRFRIKGEQEPNDYRMMKEVLKRRLLREVTDQGKWERPDLILIDGGKGQLNAVQQVVNELNVTGIDLAALAKAKRGEPADKVYLPGRKNPLRLKSNLLHLLMRIRDEAHRFAIAYHKKIREKELL